MPRSQFVSSGRLASLIRYFAFAFVVLLGVSALVPHGSMRSMVVGIWLVAFPAGGWWVFQRGAEE